MKDVISDLHLDKKERKVVVKSIADESSIYNQTRVIKIAESEKINK